MVKHSWILLILLITVDVNGFSQGAHFLIAQNENFDVAWISPTIQQEVGKYKKMELSLKLEESIRIEITKFLKTNSEGLNPFNPEDISLEAEFISPTKKKKIIYGFYYEDYNRSGESWRSRNIATNWRVRFSPNEIGEWSFSIKLKVKNEVYDSKRIGFKCVPSNKKGRIIVKKDSRYFHLSETGEPFFTIGHNITHSAYYKVTPKRADLHKKWLTELAENGGNFYRLELGAQNGLPDWNDYKNYSSKMPQMWEFDNLIEHSENLGLYFILFRHHTEIENGSSWDVAYWHNNPYKIAFNLEEREAYFTNKEIIKWQKNTLRYIFSRWGYSSSFAFYEYQEVDNWYKELQKEKGLSDKEGITFFKDWYLEQKQYMKDGLGVNQLMINTYASTPKFEFKSKNDGMFANSDAIGFHRYGQNKEENYLNKYDKAKALYEEFKKPILIEEMGVTANAPSNFLALYKCSGVEFHNSIWATSFMGTAGTGMNWWWDRGIHDFKRYEDYQALSLFFKEEKFDEENYLPQKWHSKISLKRALIENYALKNKDETRVIGWVHNATHYWRNLNSSCMEELKKNGHFVIPHKLEDGILLGKKEEEKTDYLSRTDAYSKKGVQNVVNQNFEIKGLKISSAFGKKEWYKVKFTSTISNEVIVEQVLKTNIWGRLKLKYPEKDEPDFSYKITYLEKSKKEPK